MSLIKIISSKSLLAHLLLLFIVLILSFVFYLQISSPLGFNILIGLLAAFFCLVAMIKYPKQSLIAFGVFLLFQDLLTRGIGSLSPRIGMLVKRTDEVIILLFFLIFILRNRFIPMQVYFPLIGVLLIGILSTIFAGAHITPALIDLFLMFKVYFLYIIASHFHWKEKEVATAAKVFLSVGLFILIFGILDLVYPSWRIPVGLQTNLYIRSGLSSAQSIFNHPGSYADVMSVYFIYSLGYYAVTRRKSAFGLIILFAIGVIFSLRLRPLITISGALTITSLIFRNRLSIRILTMLTIITIILSILFSKSISEIIQLKLAEFSGTSARYMLTTTSIRIAMDKFPFGTGFGTFGGYASRLFYSPVYYEYQLDTVYGLTPVIVNNQDFIMDTHWPYILGELGVLGFLFYILIIFIIGRTLVKIYKNTESKFIKLLAYSGLAGLIFSSIAAFVAPVFQASLSGYYTLLFPGITFALYRSAKQNSIVLQNYRERHHYANPI